jgi:hypothetical protein
LTIALPPNIQAIPNATAKTVPQDILPKKKETPNAINANNAKVLPKLPVKNPKALQSIPPPVAPVVEAKAELSINVKAKNAKINLMDFLNFDDLKRASIALKKIIIDTKIGYRA